MDKSVSTEWLTWLYGESFEGNISICGHRNWAGRKFTDIDAAVRYALDGDRANEGGMGGVYHRLTTVNSTAPRRGVDEDSASLPAIMLDLDLRGPGHVSEEYPETVEQLREVIAAAGLPAPSAWVNSGGGRYPCWKLTTPVTIDATDQVEFKRIQEAVRSAQRAVREAAEVRGWKLDNTSDLARVYRLPGSTNRKADEPRPTSWEIDTDETYELSELLDGLVFVKEEALAPTAAPAEVEQMSSLMRDMLGVKPERDPEEPRVFTREQAIEFVRPFVEKLSAAQDGEINTRLSDAACAFAHFGPEFWPEATADQELALALGRTAYDGQTWHAKDSVDSARRKIARESWKATLRLITIPADEAFDLSVGEVPAVDAVDALIAEMLSPDDVVNRPAPRYLIHGLLQFDSESWIIGAPGSKKSFVVLDMAARVLRGEPWQGRRTNPADVVMIVAEGAGGVGKRIAAWQREYGKIPDGLYILPRPVQVTKHDDWRVLIAACGKLAERARERGRGLMVVLDTQARVTVGLKENDATDMGQFIHAIGAIRRETAGCVLTVHHTGRTGGDARGSSAIDGAQTTELTIEKIKGKALAGRLKASKQKDIEEIPDLELGFSIVDVGVDEDGMPLTSLVMCEQDSISFRQAWSASEADGETLELEAAAAVTPLKARTSVEGWIVSYGDKRATLQHWIVQTLVDTAGSVGLTEAKVRQIVEEKRGKGDTTTWGRAWGKVTDDGGDWDGIVIPGASGGQRWTVDRMAIEAVEK